uniref:Cytochrome P450 n=1 Tax=Leersia perrieri TaxID=77586 RepID=A0A0D9VD42_9ORYZ
MRVSRMPARIARNRSKMHRLMDAIIREHQEESFRRRAGAGEEEDLVDVLLRLQKEADSQFPLATDNIKFVLLGAGADTSSTVLTWAMAELMRSPRVRPKLQHELRREFAGDGKVTEEKLRENVTYLHMVIKETLRLHPPVPLLIPHQCRTPCRVLGHDVPVGATVMVNAWAIGRDPTAWGGGGDAGVEEFLPERFESLSRSAPDDGCAPDWRWGWQTWSSRSPRLLLHFDFKLPAGMSPEEVDMTEVAGVTTWRRDDLLVVAVPRIPAT